jgi:hypothetical protein
MANRFCALWVELLKIHLAANLHWGCFGEFQIESQLLK